MASGRPGLSTEPSEDRSESENESSIDEEEEGRRITTFYASRQHNLPKFLELYKPSVTRSSDGVAWVCVQGPNYECTESFPEGMNNNLKRLMEGWEKMMESGHRINMTSVMNLAKDHNILRGKWLFYVPKWSVDRAWDSVARAVASGQCGDCAKVSLTVKGNGWHVVCVYNNDFSDRNSVMGLEDSLRRAGIKHDLTYKPDAFTHMGIYQGNEWNLWPTLYRSRYDIIQKASRITCNFA